MLISVKTCRDRDRLQQEAVNALNEYVSAVTALQATAAEKTSPEFAAASKTVHDAKTRNELAAWHFRRHREKHGC
jgi:hypothetical protein